jgi:hypothetical protein
MKGICRMVYALTCVGLQIDIYSCSPVWKNFARIEVPNQYEVYAGDTLCARL